ncbi:MAG: hypothetical protein A2161_14420 [Candidatus Schekmanbacteria bacterium RBG_13_48_7]|uniref:Uncharacterized protein n=1 Tax=Candidatus Schekmanbacteria bacterium RBG_13_48_7 TaxID=1817878 RepID=A0A1F7S1Q4_9BACT|nr:MAG: hypothetical protein A2161_14420 [Candidatus Schekmanbacteria bacterium RBG_13_48_7]
MVIIISAGGQIIEVDEDAFLSNTQRYAGIVGNNIRAYEGMNNLSPSHIKVIQFFMDFYNGQSQVNPTEQQITQGTGLSADKIRRLFPKSTSNSGIGIIKFKKK